MNGNFQVLRPNDIGPEMKQKLLGLGNQSGMWKESDIDYFSQKLDDSANINVVYLEGEKLLGHILSRPHNDAVRDYLEEDPLMKANDVPMFYVEHLIVDESVSGRHLGIKLIVEMIAEANKRQVYMFSNHCRTVNGLSHIVQKKFKDGVRVVRRIQNYVDCNNEPFDYLEIEVRP